MLRLVSQVAAKVDLLVLALELIPATATAMNTVTDWVTAV